MEWLWDPVFDFMETLTWYIFPWSEQSHKSLSSITRKQLKFLFSIFRMFLTARKDILQNCVNQSGYIMTASLRRLPYWLFWRQTYLQTFSSEFLSIWVQFPEKTACYRPFKNGNFVRVSTEKMMDRQYKENGARNMYSNYNQMRANVECFPNQSKKYTLSTFPSSNRQNFEDSGKVLAISCI